MSIEKKEVKLPKNFWKKKLEIKEFDLVPKLPVDNLTLQQQYNHYLLNKDYFILKKKNIKQVKKK